MPDLQKTVSLVVILAAMLAGFAFDPSEKSSAQSLARADSGLKLMGTK